MVRRGLLAEIVYQNQLARRKSQQAATAAARRNATAQRQVQQAALRSERARAQLARSTAATQKQAALEVQRAHVEAMEADAEARNAQLHEELESVETLLVAALATSSYVDLDELRVKVEHPAFSASELESPMPVPELIVAPPEPTFVEPRTPTGLSATFGGKKRHAEALEQAKRSFEDEHNQWLQEAAKIPSIQLGQMQAHQRFEEERVKNLSDARAAYDAECAKREAETSEANRTVDDLVAGIEREDAEALKTYVSIVLGNSAYPESFPVTYDEVFNAELHELSLEVNIPGPSTMTAIREYKYNKAKDEIVTVYSTQKQVKDRYAEVVYAVALRTLHEVFEADRVGHIKTIALGVFTEDSDPATGLMKRATLVKVAVDRETFSTYDLTKVVPLATLQHMKALVAKSPFDMSGVDESRGVRNRGK